MRSPRPVDRIAAVALAITLGAAIAPCPAAPITPTPHTMTDRPAAADILTATQRAIIPIAALGAAGDLPGLEAALHRELDAGLTVSEAKEVLVQLYAYAGFPRSLNALGTLMTTVDARKQRGITDAVGTAPSHAIATGDALLAVGTSNQTRLAGAPVTGPLFAFAPAIDQYLKAHLFGDIFERDNLDRPTWEVATVSMLSALQGVEAQLQSHLHISLNVGLTVGRLGQLADVLDQRVDGEAAARCRAALARQMSIETK